MKHPYIKKIVSAVLLSLVFTFFIFPEDAAQAQSSQTNFRVAQKVRNLTKQSFAWVDSLQADAGDRIEFQVTVTWQGPQPTQSVFVREALADKLLYVNNLKLDGVLLAGDISRENVTIGTLASGQSRIVTFEAQVAAAELLSPGTANLVNTVTVFNAEGGATTTTTVQVTKAGSPTDVSTGPLSVWMIWAVFFFVAALCVGSFLFLRSYVKREVFESPYATRVDRKLAVMINGIKRSEKRS